MPMATATEALTTQGTRPSLPKENLSNRVAAKKKTNEKNAIYFIQFVAEIRLVTTCNSYFFVFGLIYFPFILRKVLLKVQLGNTHRWIKIKKVFAMFLKYLEHQTCISADCKIRNLTSSFVFIPSFYKPIHYSFSACLPVAAFKPNNNAYCHPTIKLIILSKS